MSEVLNIITATNLTYDQKVMKLAQAAENTVSPMKVPERFRYYQQYGALCDMGEGAAPYRPRYIMVDFARFVRQGSPFLRLDPPKDLDDLLNALMILYWHIPSITGHPVYIGDLDELIDPFLDGVDDETAKRKLAHFLNFVDRTIADGYCHANMGPRDTRAGRLLLQVEQVLQNAVPNFTLRYDPDITGDEFARLALETSLACANPAFCNDRAHRNTYEGGYGISSCYNILPIGGGAYCLSRIPLPRLAAMADSIEHFLEVLLPDACQALGAYMNERVRFLVEDSGFFQSSFLVAEGLIDPERFVGMYGVAGMCDCVNLLLADQGLRYGHDDAADDLADEIMQRIAGFVDGFEALYAPMTGGRHLLHAQAGLSTDPDVTPGMRITVGDEPENLFDHLRHSARFHRFFPTGCSDIFPLEATVKDNLNGILDAVKGAFLVGDKYMSFYASESDLVRITGYLVKRSDIERYDKGEAAMQDTVANGSGNYKANRLHGRKVRR